MTRVSHNPGTRGAARAWWGMTIVRPLSAGCALLLVACQPGGAEGASSPGGEETALPDADSTAAYRGIAADETVHFTGTEPFWGGEVGDGTLIYTTPENPDGARIAVERFAGRGGVSFSGSLDGADFEMTLTPLECSDGMSDRTYPFTATLKIGDELRNGCGWTERQPFMGPAQP